MITGVGIDVIEVERVMKKVKKNNGFREKVFSKHEIAFCESKPNTAENYAARFAAKEAFLKATGFGLSLGHQLSDIEIVNDKKGKPMVQLKRSFKSQSLKNKWNKIHVSISHLKAIACAVVIIER